MEALEQNQMFTKQTVENWNAEEKIHRAKRKQREMLEEKFLEAHKGNTRRDGPFVRLSQQERD